MGQESWICLARVASPHGLKGWVKLKSYMENPEDIFTFPTLSTETGQTFQLHLQGHQKDLFLVTLEKETPQGWSPIADRNASEAITSLTLGVDRSLLPEPQEDEFYHLDLIGLAAYATDAPEVLLGHVTAVQDYGGGDVLTINSDEHEYLVLFSDAAVPTVDLTARRLLVAREHLIEE